MTNNIPDPIAYHRWCKLQVQMKKWEKSSETIPPLIGRVRRTPAPLAP